MLDLLFMSTELLKRILNHHSDERRRAYIEDNFARVLSDFKYISSAFKDQNPRILNIGADPFLLEDIVLESGFKARVTSVDVGSDWAKMYAQQRSHRLIAVDVETTERSIIEFDQYDLVVMAEVIEHFRLDLLGLLSDIYARVKIGGFVYVTTPNFFSIKNLLYCILFQRSGPIPCRQWNKLKVIGHMGHVREYTKPEIIELYQFVGFQCYDSGYRNIFVPKGKSAVNLAQRFLDLIQYTIPLAVKCFSASSFCMFRKS